MNHLRSNWAHLTKTAWHQPDNIRGYPLPMGGQFGSSKPFLDPDIFDTKSEIMHPWISDTIIGILGAYWSPKYGSNWKDWTRIYLAGSLASYWWGTPDFDTLVGVDTRAFIKQHPGFSMMSDHEVCEYLTHEFVEQLDPLTHGFSFPPAPDAKRLILSLGGQVPGGVESAPESITPFGPLDEVTFYVNPAGYDIRVIRPYAAYEMIHDKWYVHPIHMDKLWGAHALSHAFWEKMADIADEIKAALAIKNVGERTERCLALYDKIHTERGQAFSPAGGGITDQRSLQWVVLNRWGLLGPLEVAAHPGREMAHIPPAVASKYR